MRELHFVVIFGDTASMKLVTCLIYLLAPSSLTLRSLYDITSIEHGIKRNEENSQRNGAYSSINVVINLPVLISSHLHSIWPIKKDLLSKDNEKKEKASHEEQDHPYQWLVVKIVIVIFLVIVDRPIMCDITRSNRSYDSSDRRRQRHHCLNDSLATIFQEIRILRCYCCACNRISEAINDQNGQHQYNLLNRVCSSMLTRNMNRREKDGEVSNQ
mmetsp:Transcript_12019/g.12950  ORF Transcript_12019/g.12950 Transcript_12019/m.12950 type:complete len:215 (+) Transcript_12019:284-928(+)